MVSQSVIIFRTLILLSFFILLDVYVWQSIKSAFVLHEKWRMFFKYFMIISTVIIVCMLLFFIFNFKPNGKTNPNFMLLFGVFIMFFVPKLLIASGLIIEDLFRFFTWVFIKIKNLTSGNLNTIDNSRKAFISQVLLGIGAIPFLGILHGITIGKHKYKVHRVNLKFKDLPPSFDGFTITQISDVHSGSFTNTKKVNKGIDIINQLNSDLVLFTGDLVNNIASEMDKWKTSFARIEAKYGKYSIFGNHDYGDYVAWESPTAKQSNIEVLKKVHQDIGFNLLTNQNVRIKKGEESINIIGIENWGLPPFPQYGDLQKATVNLDNNGFNILMSHDPSHWDAEAKNYNTHFHLTLSGHTHGMQFGIEIPGFKWSPVKYKYPKWAGLFQHEQQEKYLYVNRGFGYLAFPGRVGIWPEITVITLSKA